MKRWLILVLMLLLFLDIKDIKWDIKNAQAVPLTRSLSLSDALQPSLENHPAVVAASWKVKSAEQDVRFAVSTAFPTIGLEGSYGGSYTEPSTFIFNGNPVTAGTNDVLRNLRYGVTLQQTVWSGDRLGQGLKGAEENLAASREDLKKAKLDVILQVTQSFYQLALARQMVHLYETTLAANEEELWVIKAQYEAHVVPKTDLLRSQIQAQNTRQSLRHAKRDEALAQRRLANDLPDRDVSKANLQMDPLSDSLSKMTSDPALVHEMMRARPEWTGMAHQIEVAKATYAYAQADLGPLVRLSGNYYASRYDYPSFGYNQASWNATLGASWTLFNGFGSAAKADAAKGRYEALVESQEALRRNLEVELADAALTLQQAQKDLEDAQNVVSLARENANQIRAMYRAHVKTHLDLMDAESTLLSSETNRVAAEISVRLAKARLDRTLGRFPL